MMFLARFFKRLRKTLPASDPWDGSATFYVGVHRKEIEKVARALSKPESPLRTRFNQPHKCAEIHFECGLTLAQVNMHGEFGSAYAVIIATAFSLADDVQAAIRRIFPERIEVKYVVL